MELLFKINMMLLKYHKRHSKYVNGQLLIMVEEVYFKGFEILCLCLKVMYFCRTSQRGADFS